MAAVAERPLAEAAAKPFLGLLNGIAQCTFYGNAEITEELLRDQLYPETAPQEFRALLAKTTGVVKSIASADMDLNQLEAFLTAQTKKPGGITTEQAAVIAKFWKSHRVKIRDSLINQSKWENSLKNISWRVDLKSQSRHADQLNNPVAIVEMELGKHGQMGKSVSDGDVYFTAIMNPSRNVSYSMCASAFKCQGHSGGKEIQVNKQPTATRYTNRRYRVKLCFLSVFLIETVVLKDLSCFSSLSTFSSSLAVCFLSEPCSPFICTWSWVTTFSSRARFKLIDIPVHSLSQSGPTFHIK
ncbi:COMM domain-containing protein 1 isoform X1 [Zootoca vivipara]|uniref:COMM domain-containing protein 1 isoform X1 n=1 Tax=Zootoca vivipara TaxID=8524 RepID=UPI00293B90F0|nr:COMM domain-containing protein 1 isoform X1 [Zootoca vivipara]